MRTNCWQMACAAIVLALAMAGCPDDGSRGLPGAAGAQGPPPPIETNLDRFTALPGLNITVLSLGGATGATGNFQVGDTMTVTFTVTLDDGTDVPLDELDSGSIYVSGPTTNYQRVIVSQSDLRTASVENANGTYTYTFSVPIPAVYEAPYNDTATFTDGELTGLALQDGTYTVGMQCYKYYTIETESVRDVANATEDFLFGNAATLDAREVVTTAHCNQCHHELQAHGGSRRDARLCVLCHTAGSEDKNVASVEGGTPDVTVEFGVMIHRIHNGAHLPSVLGVATNVGGSRNYAATPEPYVIVGYQNSVHDFSEVGFPVWPNMNIAMPRDQGYTGLTAGQQSLENTIRMGVTDCDKCHGDPDGSGPLEVPADGDLHASQPSRRMCGACHDDVDWTLDYTANGSTMTAQGNDSGCTGCHDATDVDTDHLHPLLDTAVNPGLNFGVTDVVDTDLDGYFEAGEKVQIQFTLTDDSAAAVSGDTLNSCAILIAGPIENRNILVSSSLPTWDPDGAGPLVATVPASIIGAGPNYAINVPEALFFERAVVPAGLIVTTARTPIWCDDNTNWSSSARTAIRERTAVTVRTTLASAAVALQRYVDVVSTAGFAANDWIMLDSGLGTEEYAQIPLIQGNRLWLSAPLKYAHAPASAADEATMTTRSSPGDWTITSYATGQITCDGVDLINGDVIIISYIADYIVPTVFPPNLQDSPDIDATWGDWVGLPLRSGTYQVDIYGYVNRIVTLFAETNTYRGTSNPAVTDVLVDSPTDPTPAELTPYELVDDHGAGCYSCHNDAYFHGGGRRGYDTCIMCHGTPAEDRAQYARTSASATPRVLAEFRQMLHRIHRGAELANAATYGIEGNSSISYFDEIEFPAMPGGVAECEMCHGEGNTAYHEPADRTHPSQTLPTRSWRTVCTSCHDDGSAAGHADLMTSLSGVESCGACHGPGQVYEVELMHWVR